MANADKYDNFLSTVRGTSSSTWTQAQELELLEPFTYISANPGRELRARLIEGFNLWLKVPKDKLVAINRIVTLLHNASLMVDDIEDDSQLRRGIPVAHKIYGVAQTINTANYVYFLAYQELSALRPTVLRRDPPSTASSDSGLGDDSPVGDKFDLPHRIIPDYDMDLIVNAELMSLHRGQGMDILWRDTLRCPSEDEYVEMVKAKTGGLLRIVIKLMMACATANTDVDYIPLTDVIGVFYQIRDDYMNLNAYSDEKGFADDLSEGKFSFPVVHGILRNPENREIMSVLQKRPKTPTLKHHAMNYLKDTTKSFDYTVVVLGKLEQQARAEIERLGGNPLISAVLDLFHVDA